MKNLINKYCKVINEYYRDYRDKNLIIKFHRADFNGNKLLIHPSCYLGSLYELPDVDTTLKYTPRSKDHFECNFFNRDGSQANLCCNALFLFMNYKGTGKYLFYLPLNRKIMGRYNKDSLQNKRFALTFTDFKINSDVFEMIDTNTAKVNLGNTHIVHCHNIYKDYIYAYEDKKQKFNRKGGVNEHIAFFSMHRKGAILVKNFENGVGETESCGSGALATGIAYCQMYNVEECNVRVARWGRYYYSIRINKALNQITLESFAPFIELMATPPDMGRQL